jgi:hypothetical protein
MNSRTLYFAFRRFGSQLFSRFFPVLCLFVMVTTASILWGSVTGSISGTVSDASGAVIPGVSVATLNTGTGVKESTKTNAQGFHSLPALPVGHYNLSIQARGFKEYLETGLTLDVNTALRVDVSWILEAQARMWTHRTSRQARSILQTRGQVRLTLIPPCSAPGCLGNWVRQVNGSSMGQA